MTDPRMRLPGLDHPISITPHSGRVVVRVGGVVIADTRAALVLREASFPPVHYIPRADVDMTQLKASPHQSYCPYKGAASYFDIPSGGRRADNAAWSYEQPYPAVQDIAGYIAFYPDSTGEIVVS